MPIRCGVLFAVTIVVKNSGSRPRSLGAFIPFVEYVVGESRMRMVGIKECLGNPLASSILSPIMHRESYEGIWASHELLLHTISTIIKHESEIDLG